MRNFLGWIILICMINHYFLYIEISDTRKENTLMKIYLASLSWLIQYVNLISWADDKIFENYNYGTPQIRMITWYSSRLCNSEGLMMTILWVTSLRFCKRCSLKIYGSVGQNAVLPLLKAEFYNVLTLCEA